MLAETFGDDKIVECRSTINLDIANTDLYFDSPSDFKTTHEIHCTTGLGFFFICETKFVEYLTDIVLRNDKISEKFALVDGTYVFDERIVIITSKYFDDLPKLVNYSKKLRLSPYKLNSLENAPYKLMKNFISYNLGSCVTSISPPTVAPIRGGIIKCNNKDSYYETVYEYDIVACYPNIIIKYIDDTEPINVLMKLLIHDELKMLKLWLYGFLGNPYTVLYNPRIMNEITSIGRMILKQYESRALMITTDAVFMSYRIIPNFAMLDYKENVHNSMFIINAGTYFTDNQYKGLPRGPLSKLVHDVATDFIKSDNQFKFTGLSLINFMSRFVEFTVLPIPLRCGIWISALLGKEISPNMVDKYLYLYKYRNIIYSICNFKSENKISYEKFKILYNMFICSGENLQN
jgi:hypothetical protein